LVPYFEEISIVCLFLVFFQFSEVGVHGKHPKVALAFICDNFEKIAQMFFFPNNFFWKIEHFLSFIILENFYLKNKSATDYFN